MIRRGFDLVEGGTPPADLLDDFVGGLGPNEGLRVVVPSLGPETDFLGELCDAAKHATAQPTVGEQSEPAFYEIEPARTGGREVQMPAGLGGPGHQSVTSGVPLRL